MLLAISNEHTWNVEASSNISHFDGILIDVDVVVV